MMRRLAAKDGPLSQAFDETQNRLQRLVRGLHQRHLLRAGSPTRVALERLLLEEIGTLGSSLANRPPAPEGAPLPRRVAVAFAFAAFSHPHLAATFGHEQRGGTMRVKDPPARVVEAPLLLSQDALERQIRLSRWELEDLRELVDRRAGSALKRERALGWLWNHFDVENSGAASLVSVLFPDVPDPKQAELIRRASRLYVLADVPESSLSTIYLGWVSANKEAHRPPVSSFRTRSVDGELRRQLARAVGGEPGEVEGLLSQMVVLVPKGRVEAFLEWDRWRVGGYAVLTGLGDQASDGVRLTHPLDRHDLDWTRWLGVEGGRVVVDRNQRGLFDEFALERAQRALGHVYAGMLARASALPDGPASLQAEDLDLLDVPLHLATSLQPLVDWARSSETREQVATRLGVARVAVDQAMDPLALAWEERLRSRWLAPPTPERLYTISGLILAHLIATHEGLVRLLKREPEQRRSHRDLGLLFAAHYFSEAPIERLWLKSLTDMPHDSSVAVPPPEDILGTWFWPGWSRVLQELTLSLEPLEG